MKLSNARTAVAAALVLVATNVGADDISDQLDVAKEVYASGDYRKTVQELQYAISQLQELIDTANTTLLPEPLDGWTAEPAQAQSGGMAAFAGGTAVSRSYLGPAGERVTVEIVADSPLLQATVMMLTNPMMMQMNPAMRMYRYKGYNGMINHEAGSDSWELSLLLFNRVLVKSSGTGLSDKKAAEEYLRAVDFDAVGEAFNR